MENMKDEFLWEPTASNKSTTFRRVNLDTVRLRADERLPSLDIKQRNNGPAKLALTHSHPPAWWLIACLPWSVPENCLPEKTKVMDLANF